MQHFLMTATIDAADAALSPLALPVGFAGASLPVTDGNADAN